MVVAGLFPGVSFSIRQISSLSALLVDLILKDFEFTDIGFQKC